ncbi:Replication termination factor 2 [Linderina macrospora]|uniref:Replication termination factor 2 n=1 Tax=Linderina macrospora TaxID=4868 RepID=A0ACC1JBJ4_9FUNG|nr:Replication termination factor 2 [Linderina macrospora]
MGNDGGSIPRRSEMVKEKQKSETADKSAQLQALFYYCALSKQPLAPPIVGDSLGRLYNKDAIITYLLDKTSFGDGQSICADIKSLKDVVTLTVKPNPTSKHKTSILSFDAQQPAPFVCPVSLKEMNGHTQFEFVWTCGCVFAALARKEMVGKAVGCPVCAKPFAERDVVPVNSTDEGVLAALRERVKERKAEEKARKSKNKAKRKRSVADEAAGSLPDGDLSLEASRVTKVRKSKA